MMAIESIISALVADSGNADFTGYLSNAHVVDDSRLSGEVWRHQRASSAGEFADGHLIETSRIVRVYTAGTSVWIDTESGSRYGILSFTPLGMRDLLSLGGQDGLDHPLSARPAAKEKSMSRKGLAGVKPKRRTAAPVKGNGRHPLRPPANPDYIKQISEHFHRQLEGIRLFQQECAQRKSVAQPGESDEPTQR
ncbi:hypothetical protein V2K65_10300 [Pseudomonas alliivorans]|nr:hypothetical protein [Pseudomonas alliivorans]